jgi:hypothetical protein
MAGTITGETKREGQKKRPKDAQPTEQKKRKEKEKASPSRGRKLSHP